MTLFGRCILDSGGNRLAPALHFSSRSFSSSQSSLEKSGESTLNQEEVDKFRAMSSTWWDPKGVCRPLHSMNRLRVPLVREGLLQEGTLSEAFMETDKPLTGLKLLDVGCGAGLLSEPLARIGASVVGLDACTENIEAAREHLSLDPELQERLSYQCCTVEEHAENLDGPCYDAVVASEVIEHVDNPEIFLTKCSQLLKPGGSIFLTTINRSTSSWLLAIVGAEYVLGLLPRGTHEWDKFVKPEELGRLLEGRECTVRSVKGMMYLPPPMDSWSWTSDCSVNFALHAVKKPPDVQDHE